MDWKDLASVVSKSAPLLGSLLAGPAGGAVGSLIATALGSSSSPDDVSLALATNPDAAVKLRQIEADESTKLKEFEVAQIKAELEAASQAIVSINETMRAETVSEHWPSYSWRPAIGFAVALAVLLSVLTVFLAYGAVLLYGKSEGLAALPGILASIAGIIAVVSPILGIASWFRGRMQADPTIPTNNKG